MKNNRILNIFIIILFCSSCTTTGTKEILQADFYKGSRHTFPYIIMNIDNSCKLDLMKNVIENFKTCDSIIRISKFYKEGFSYIPIDKKRMEGFINKLSSRNKILPLTADLNRLLEVDSADDTLTMQHELGLLSSSGGGVVFRFEFVNGEWLFKSMGLFNLEGF